MSILFQSEMRKSLNRILTVHVHGLDYSLSFFYEINLPIDRSLPRKEVVEGKYMCS